MFVLLVKPKEKEYPFYLPKPLLEKKWRCIYHLEKRIDKFGWKEKKKAFRLLQLNIKINWLKLIQEKEEDFHKSLYKIFKAFIWEHILLF